MSKRSIKRAPDVERKKQYLELEGEGVSQKALWAALETLQAQGIDIGLKAKEVLDKRVAIKQGAPK